MSKAIHHRGPDSSGFWLDEALGLGLVHTRLSIVELSELGAQPMVSHCSNFVMVFNGEIYNHLDIRSEIQKKGMDVKWRGHSDTETLLEAISLCGIDWALEQSIGMFAFAVWNKATAKLVLARDRMGEKPLYAGWLGQASGAKVFGFASELKALNAENARLVEEQGAYQALLDPKTGIGREVSVSSLTVRPSTGGWKFFALVSGGAVPSSAFKGSAVVELAGAVRGEEERVLADVPARSFRLEYRNGQLISGEVVAAGAPASALRVLVVDEAGRTRATQRVALP